MTGKPPTHLSSTDGPGPAPAVAGKAQVTVHSPTPASPLVLGEAGLSVGGDLVRVSEVHQLLSLIRPAWQARDLIGRVYKLLPVDASSACQRVFNAAIHDLREKVVIAGLDIAKQAAQENKLPPLDRQEDVENYPTAKLIDLAYRMGLLSRPEWRRLSRVYEIRRDLEHEDDEYEAGVEDCIYVFKTCIEVVLARDPVQVLRVTDVKEAVEQPVPAAPSQSLLDDYAHAPQPRQLEILRFLVSTALNSEQPDVVRQNAFSLLHRLSPLTQRQVTLEIAEHFQKRLARNSLDHLHARIAYAAGILPYIKQAQRLELFEAFYSQLKKVSPSWRAHADHGGLLRTLLEVGGLLYVPPPVRQKIVEWLVVTYLGEPGGVTSYGSIRHVYYSDTAAPIIRELVARAGIMIRDELKWCEQLRQVEPLLRHQHIARRFQELLDVVETRSTSP